MNTQTQIIRDFGGRTIAKIDTQSNGDKIIRDFYGRVLGKYDKRANVTRDFHGRVIAKGDSLGMLIGTSR